jgi:DNA-binding winged helix-turn-helix (wHTH) protein/TolB-like protein
MSANIVRFSDFELNTSTGELRRAGVVVKLQPQPMKVLVLLAQQAGQVVTRDQLQVAVWGNDTVVDYENGLNWSIRKVREALGDDPLGPKFIETVPKKGYRFIAQIITPASHSFLATETRRFPRLQALAMTAAFTLCFMLIGTGFLQQRRHSAQQTTIVVLPFDNLTGKTSQDYLATAATDQVITGIGSRSHLNVIDRATAAKLKRTEECIIRIGEQLHADFVVEGSLVGPPEAPLITAGIYRVRDNTKLWAGQLTTGTDSGLSAYRIIAAKVGEIAE